MSTAVRAELYRETTTRVVTLAERPDLAPAVVDVITSRWPAFMLAGEPGHGADLTELASAVPQHQLALLAENDDEVLGVGRSVPLHWDGTAAGLPAGWDGAVTAAAELVEQGAAPTAVSALSITLTPAATGRGLASPLLAGMKRAASQAGASALIVPVRPVLKSRYPLMPMDQYVAWRTEQGAVFDPWLRLHLAHGGTILGIADPSLTVTGSLDEWSDWVGLPLGESGEYVIPGGLVPLTVDRQANIAIYREPNVWVRHRVTE